MGRRHAEGNTMKRTMVRCTATLAVMVAAHIEGCATGAAPRDFARRERPIDAFVTVSNMTPLPVRIFLRHGSVDVALGIVMGLASRTFDVTDPPIVGSGDLQLEARDRSGRVALRSDTFTFGARRAASWQVDMRSTRVDAW